MEFQPQPHLKLNHVYQQQSLQNSDKMSTLTMSAPNHHAGFHREFSWQESRMQQTYKPQEDHTRIALPSIRQAFPELQLQTQQDPSSRAPTTAGASPATSPGYMYSTNSTKRRRLSIEIERDDETSNKVPRLYENSQIYSTRHASPPRQSWADSDPQPSLLKSAGQQPTIVEPRPTLPSLPHLSFDRRHNEMPRLGSISNDEYSTESNRRTSIAHTLPQQEIRSVSASYDYHTMARAQPQQSALGPNHAPYERSPFTPGAYPHHYQRDPYMRIGDLGMGQAGENKQRKRRGNLPKETTDKLRAWFVSHLQHPYPTEDEKQDLMRQTGLQMNQISNWFINARRRQLPTMINNARAESDAMSGRGNDDRVLPSTERADHYGNSSRTGGHLSDGEGSLYDEELSHHPRVSHIQRGSV